MTLVYEGERRENRNTGTPFSVSSDAVTEGKA